MCEKGAPETWHLLHIFDKSEVDGGDKQMVIQGVRQLTQEEVAAFDADNQIVMDYASCLRLVKALRLNVQDFVDAVQGYGETFAETYDLPEHHAEEMSLNLSRLLVNITAMFRAAVDHSDVYFSRNFGAHSEEMHLWKSAQAAAYDGAFGYRFLYRLRNYIQHVDLPPIAVSMSSSASVNHVTVRVDFERDELLVERTKWKSLAEELARQPERISALEVLNEWDKAFADLAIYLMQSRADRSLAAANRILGLRNVVDKTYGRVAIGAFPAAKGPILELNLNLKWLPIGLATTIVRVTERE